MARLRAAIPKEYQGRLGDAAYLKVANAIMTNKDVAGLVEDNFVTFADTLKQGRYTVDEYLNAVLFTSLLLAGLNDVDAYARVFPKRIKRLTEEKREPLRYANAFKRTKLVSGMLEHAIIPAWILNQGAYQKAINTQVELMTTAKSEMVRCKAAEVLMTQLKKPETVEKREVQININTEIDSLQETIAKLAQKQLELIKNGSTTASEVVEAVIVDEKEAN